MLKLAAAWPAESKEEAPDARHHARQANHQEAPEQSAPRKLRGQESQSEHKRRSSVRHNPLQTAHADLRQHSARPIRGEQRHDAQQQSSEVVVVEPERCSLQNRKETAHNVHYLCRAPRCLRHLPFDLETRPGEVAWRSRCWTTRFENWSWMRAPERLQEKASTDVKQPELPRIANGFAMLFLRSCPLCRKS